MLKRKLAAMISMGAAVGLLVAVYTTVGFDDYAARTALFFIPHLQGSAIICRERRVSTLSGAQPRK